jgi:AcrR family transcriptional regulator
VGPREHTPLEHPGGPPTTTAKRAAVQAAVLAATEALLLERASFADLNVERIANQAGISRTAFYFYFRDKRELLMRLTADVTDRLLEQADAWFTGAGEPEAELRATLQGIGTLYAEHGVLLGAILEAATYDDEVARFWRGVVGRFADGTRRRIEAEQAAGRAEGTQAHATAFSLCWMTERALYEHLVQRDPMPLEELLAALEAIWLRAVYG